MAKKQKRKYTKAKKVDAFPEEIIRDKDVDHPKEPGGERPRFMDGRHYEQQAGTPNMEDDVDEETSDLLVVLAVLAHGMGINAVEPTPEDLATLESHIEQLGPIMDKETLTMFLKKAQIELLRRQLT